VEEEYLSAERRRAAQARVQVRRQQWIKTWTDGQETSVSRVGKMAA